jgi:hypothetical protein
VPSNDAHFSGEGHLIEAVILGDPNKTVIPVVCDSQGRLIVDLASGTSTIGTVMITDTNGNQITSTNGNLNVNVVPDEADDFGYVTGSLSGPGSVIGIGDCRGIRVFAVNVDSRFSINSGNPITLRANQIFYHIPQGELVNPTIDWWQGSIDVWMEVDKAVAPATPDLGLSLGIAHL